MNMEVEKISSSMVSTRSKDHEDDEYVPLPGFRFHPTDEELVGFYLRREVEKRPISIELIKQIDIYKHDPWDLPKASNVGDKEWYFFCKRGRKYRNSIRPNRVTGSGFWKATGIDRPIYSAGGEGRDCIGLKKSLVYYRGSAGKGTKTDWMMHEFRLPPDHDIKSTKHIDAKPIAQEAEVWTLCRIFKRNVSYRKCIPDWKELTSSSAAKRSTHNNNNINPIYSSDASSKTCSFEDSDLNAQSNFISFASSTAAGPPQRHHHPHPTSVITTLRAQQMNGTTPQNKKPPACSFTPDINHQNNMLINNSMGQSFNSPLVLTAQQAAGAAPSTTTASNHVASSYASSAGNYSYISEFLKHGDWDELRSVVELGAAPAPLPFLL